MSILKRLVVVGLIFGPLGMFSTLAQANVLTGATATANCAGYTLTVKAAELSPGTIYTIKYTFTFTSGTGVRTFPGTITFTASATTTTTETASATWGLNAHGTLTGTATLTSSGSTVHMTINGSTSATLSCAPPPVACSAGPQSLSYNVS